jgi:site-specific DNA-methyltransferase (adenine-specific)
MELTLHNGDCLEIMKGLPEKSVDLIICDLPYGCLTNQTGQSGGFYRESHKGTNLIQKLAKQSGAGVAWDIKIDLKAFWEQVKRIRKSDHSPTIHFCTTKFGFELYNSNPDEFRYDLVWDKQRGVSFLSANKMPMRSHEMIYVFSKAGAFYERKDIEGDFKNSISPNHKRSNVSNTVPRVADIHSSNEGKRCVLSVIKQPGSLKKGNHPTEKPEALYRFLIERYCPAGGTVLDPTFGSGNSVFTAFAMGRSAIGIEKDTSFYTKAEKRLQDLP